MGYNKLVIDGEIKIDLTKDTVSSGVILNGYKAHDRSGEEIIGSILNRDKDSVVVDHDLNVVTILSGYYPNDVNISIAPPDPEYPENSIRLKEVGSTVKITLNRTKEDFIIVHQGLPSDVYSSTCDGTWLLQKNIFQRIEWGYYGSGGSQVPYPNTFINSILNGNYLGIMDTDISSKILSVKIPYVDLNNRVNYGENGFGTKVFIPGMMELGFSEAQNPGLLQDGSCLKYFEGTNPKGSDTKRVSTSAYFTRTVTNDYRYGWSNCMIDTIGDWYDMPLGSDSSGVRPMFILPPDCKVDSSGLVYVD